MYSLFKHETVIHRDLKPENILIDENGRAFIADLGASKQCEATLLAELKKKPTTLAGTSNWMAPEMLKVFNSHPDSTPPARLSKLDVFSLGLITLKAIDRDGYDKQKDNLNRDENDLKKYLGQIEKQKLISDEEFLDILRRMLSFDIDSRISIEELYKWMVIFFAKK